VSTEATFCETFVAAFNWILQAKRDDCVCVNEEYYLVRDSLPTCWPVADYTRFVNGVVALWNNWQ
jgi:hypothetical protein